MKRLFANGFFGIGLVLFGSISCQAQQSFHAALDAQPDFRKAVGMVWSSVLTRCGDSSFFIQRGRDNQIKLIEFKEPFGSDIQEDKLNRADQLNGLQARGTATFNAAAARWIDNGVGSAGIRPHTPQWSKWGGGVVDGHPALTALGLVLTSLEISMTRQSGHWELSGENLDSFSDEAVHNKITCEAASTDNPSLTPIPHSGWCPVGDLCSNTAPDPEPPKVGQFLCRGAEIRLVAASRGSDSNNYSVERPIRILRSGITHVGASIVETRIEVAGDVGYAGGWYVLTKGPAQDSCSDSTGAPEQAIPSPRPAQNAPSTTANRTGAGQFICPGAVYYDGNNYHTVDAPKKLDHVVRIGNSTSVQLSGETHKNPWDGLYVLTKGQPQDSCPTK
jgi:hypothetical protein